MTTKELAEFCQNLARELNQQNSEKMAVVANQLLALDTQIVNLTKNAMSVCFHVKQLNDKISALEAVLWQIADPTANHEHDQIMAQACLETLGSPRPNFAKEALQGVVP